VVNLLSSFTRGLEFVLAGYTLPVGSDGLKVGVSGSYTKYKLDEDLLDVSLSGDATTVTLYSLYPIIRSRNLNLFGLVSLDNKHFNDKLFGTSQKKSSNDLALSLSGDARDDLLTGGVNTFELIALQGKLDYAQQSASANPSSFTVARLYGSRLQNLVNNRLLLLASFRGQYAFDNLDSTEQFQLGGPDRVRAFAPGEGTGDTGLVASLELRYLPPEEWFGRISRELVFSGFFDIGTIKFRHKPTDFDLQQETFSNRSTLTGIGIGAVWDRPRDFSARLSLAWPTSGEAVNDVKKSPRIYFLANKTF
jgi:hemolysin activation/secretion protein